MKKRFTIYWSHDKQQYARGSIYTLIVYAKSEEKALKKLYQTSSKHVFIQRIEVSIIGADKNQETISINND